jgi:hypothetical protein
LIEYLPVSTPTKALGQMTCPMGNSDDTNEHIREKVQKWIDKAKIGKLHKRNLWSLLDKQFWPAVSFEISSTTAPFAVLKEYLMRKYYDIVSMSGIHIG